MFWQFSLKFGLQDKPPSVRYLMEPDQKFSQMKPVTDSKIDRRRDLFGLRISEAEYTKSVEEPYRTNELD